MGDRAVGGGERSAGEKGAKIRVEGGIRGLAAVWRWGVGKKNRSDVGEGEKRAVREGRRKGGERKGLRERGEAV